MTPIKQQITTLHKVWTWLDGRSIDVLKPSPAEIQSLQDTLDMITALKLINFEEIRHTYQKYSMQGDMDAETVQAYLRGLESLDLLISTFK